MTFDSKCTYRIRFRSITSFSDVHTPIRTILATVRRYLMIRCFVVLDIYERLITNSRHYTFVQFSFGHVRVFEHSRCPHITDPVVASRATRDSVGHENRSGKTFARREPRHPKICGRSLVQVLNYITPRTVYIRFEIQNVETYVRFKIGRSCVCARLVYYTI